MNKILETKIEELVSLLKEEGDRINDRVGVKRCIEQLERLLESFKPEMYNDMKHLWGDYSED